MARLAHATEEQLNAYLADGVSVRGSGRILVRASEVIDDHVRASYTLNTTTDLADDSDVALALADAVCAQVEFWLEVGEEHDVDGSAGGQISVGGWSTNRLPPELAPRARRHLAAAGLLNPGVTSAIDAWVGALP